MAIVSPTSVRTDTPATGGDNLVNRPSASAIVDYQLLMQVAGAMFQPAELARLAPRTHPPADTTGAHAGTESNGPAQDPLAATEAIAFDFLAQGGKHSRPFITLAVFDALTGGRAAKSSAVDYLAELPLAIKRCALSIETFHKASLVHDDIEDDDEFRYGVPTLHRKYGIPTAINVGDYLIGLGYRLVSREAHSLGPDVVSDILDRLADAHMKLSEGQGAELIWRDSRDKRLSHHDALKIYALKTAPAFEAALHTGLRLAGPADAYRETTPQFARNLGVAFQIINDLNDWHGDNHNKLSAAGDVIGGRPTVLWALALEGSRPAERTRLEALVARQPLTPDDVRDIRELYEAANVFEMAARLVNKYQQRAESIADAIQPAQLRQLFHHLIRLVLERRRS